MATPSRRLPSVHSPDNAAPRAKRSRPVPSRAIRRQQPYPIPSLIVHEIDNCDGRGPGVGPGQNQPRGVPRKRFYKEGSKESYQCRPALARVLRSENPLRNSLPRQLREMPADMFEPEERESVWGERKLTAS